MPLLIAMALTFAWGFVEEAFNRENLAVFIFALLGRKTWARVLGIGAGLMGALGGFPLAAVSTLDVGRFSMFAPSLLLSVALAVILMLPATRGLLADWVSGREQVQIVTRLAHATH